MFPLLLKILQPPFLLSLLPLFLLPVGLLLLQVIRLNIIWHAMCLINFTTKLIIEHITGVSICNLLGNWSCSFRFDFMWRPWASCRSHIPMSLSSIIWYRNELGSKFYDVLVTCPRSCNTSNADSRTKWRKWVSPLRGSSWEDMGVLLSLQMAY